MPRRPPADRARKDQRALPLVRFLLRPADTALSAGSGPSLYRLLRRGLLDRQLWRQTATVSAMARRSVFDPLEPTPEARWEVVRNMHGAVLEARLLPPG